MHLHIPFMHFFHSFEADYIYFFKKSEMFFDFQKSQKVSSFVATTAWEKVLDKQNSLQ